MKKYRQFYTIPFFFGLMVSCNGLEKQNASGQDQKVDEALSLPLSQIEKNGSEQQIAEYVVEVYEDQNGNLWMGTMAKGVARYNPSVLTHPNGKNLTYFTTSDGLCGPTISSFAEDKDGNMWFGGHEGVNKYDGSQFTTIKRTDGLHNSGWGWIGVTADKDSRIWISSNKGVFLQDEASTSDEIPGFTRFDIPIQEDPNSSYSIYSGRATLRLHDSKGRLWFGTDGYGVYRLDEPLMAAKNHRYKFTHFTKNEGLCSNSITKIVEDKDGNIWFSCMQSFQPEMTGDGGVCRFDGETFTQFPEVKNLSENDIYSLLADSKGEVWIGATGLGVYHYDGNSFILYKGNNRMDLSYSMGIQDIFEDRNGSMWFGFSGGLFRLINDSIINVTKGGPWE